MRWMKLCALMAALALMAGALAETAGSDALPEMSPDQVKALEARLWELGYMASDPNDTYDSETRSALESFQQANGLEVTGLADGATLERLNSPEAVSRQGYLARFANAYGQMAVLEIGSVSNDVLLMQRRLTEYGFFFGVCDGEFGEDTGLAVENFQRVNGLPVTGVADGATLMRLMADTPITWTAWLTEMSAVEGDSGLNVYALQRMLSDRGLYDGGFTGSYGDKTREAVTRFQQQSGLEPTGEADTATWAALYALPASEQEPSAARFGDEGEEITAYQERLNELGFFDHEITGRYSYTTETAVRLFQMASSLEPTGRLDGQTQALLASTGAASMLDEAVQRRFHTLLDAADAAAQQDVAAIAEGLLGASFGAEDDGLYPGFSFVQYVCVQAGLPVTFPEDLIRMADRQVETLQAVDRGDIVAFQSASADAVTITLAIGAGDGVILCVTPAGGWVVTSYMDEMEGATVYCWDAGASGE